MPGSPLGNGRAPIWCHCVEADGCGTLYTDLAVDSRLPPEAHVLSEVGDEVSISAVTYGGSAFAGLTLKVRALRLAGWGCGDPSAAWIAWSTYEGVCCGGDDGTTD